MSPGLLTAWPVLLQEAVLSLFIEKLMGTVSSSHIQPTEDPADQQEHRRCAGGMGLGREVIFLLSAAFWSPVGMGVGGGTLPQRESAVVRAHSEDKGWKYGA